MWLRGTNENYERLKEDTRESFRSSKSKRAQELRALVQRNDILKGEIEQNRKSLWSKLSGKVKQLEEEQAKLVERFNVLQAENKQDPEKLTEEIAVLERRRLQEIDSHYNELATKKVFANVLQEQYQGLPIACKSLCQSLTIVQSLRKLFLDACKQGLKGNEHLADVLCRAFVFKYLDPLLLDLEEKIESIHYLSQGEQDSHRLVLVKVKLKGLQNLVGIAVSGEAVLPSILSLPSSSSFVRREIEILDDPA